MAVYIQSDKHKLLPINFESACALYGAVETNTNHILVTIEEIQSGEHDNRLKQYTFVGSVEFMNEVFKRLGKTPTLPRNSNRFSSRSTLGYVLSLNNDRGFKQFIKPVHQKVFTGLVLEGFRYPTLEKLPPETPVYVYEVFKSPIQSEYRLYIQNHQCVDIRHYSGSFDTLPNKEYYTSIIECNRLDFFPKNYVIDIGILKNGENVVIEYNDFYAIGSYGIPNDLYLKMLKERYFEIING